MKETTYTIEAAQTMSQVQDRQCDVVETADTVKEAKARVKVIMSEMYRQSAEMSEPIRYARIMKGDECLYDFFAKGYNGTDAEREREAA